MTEAAHQISSTSLMDNDGEMGSVGRSTGPDIGIMSAEAVLQPQEQSGEVVLRGESVIRAYASPDEANTAFTFEWFHTGDQGYIDRRGNLRLTGRLKELINRGGEKISPYEVEEVLLRNDGVEQAVAFAIPDPLLGETVGVAIVPKPDKDVTELRLRAWCRQMLAPHKVPREVVLVEQLPRGSTGKLQRMGMADYFGLGTHREREGARVSTLHTPK
jgi:acyl-CoA synthetase (AMP-forming)/AMP-acid ligase II